MNREGAADSGWGKRQWLVNSGEWLETSRSVFDISRLRESRAPTQIEGMQTDSSGRELHFVFVRGAQGDVVEL